MGFSIGKLDVSHAKETKAIVECCSVRKGDDSQRKVAVILRKNAHGCKEQRGANAFSMVLGRNQQVAKPVGSVLCTILHSKSTHYFVSIFSDEGEQLAIAQNGQVFFSMTCGHAVGNVFIVQAHAFCEPGFGADGDS
jgi:hypothetical protein